MHKGVEAHFICYAIWRQFLRICQTTGFISTAQWLSADLCVAEGNVLMKNEDYKPSEDATASDPPPINPAKMLALGHSAVYRNFYALAVFLLTLHLT